MSKGTVVSDTFNNGCKFEVRWEQEQYPEGLYSKLRCELWFYNPTDSTIILDNPWVSFGLSVIDGSYGESTVICEFGKRELDNPYYVFTISGKGFHRLSDYISHGYTQYPYFSFWAGISGDAVKFPHYSSGVPKYSFYVPTNTVLLQGAVYVQKSSSDTRTGYQFDFPGGEEILLDPLDMTTVPDDPDSGGSSDPVIIGKPSTIICPNTYIGDIAKISITANEKDVRHTIVYTFGSLTGSIIVQTTNLTVGWEIPYNFIYEIPTGASHGTCSLTCHTYDNKGNVIGATSTTFLAKMDVNKEAPTFDPIIRDTYSKTLALTGDENVFVRYYSNAYVDVGAEGKLGATIEDTEIRCGGKWSPVSPTVLYKVESADFELSATDSRGATAETTINKILIPYTKISCNVFDLNLTTDGTLTFFIEGNYFNDTFGKVSNSLTIRYRINEGTYYNVSSSNIEITGHNYRASVTAIGLQYNEIYTIEAIAEDKLSSAGEGNTYTVTGESLFDWGKEDFNFNIQVKAQQGIQIAPDQAVYGDDQGELHEALVPLDSTGNTVLGRGGYLRNNGNTTIYGTNVDVNVHEDFTVNGMSLINNKLLWQGGLMMSAGHTANLSENISQQKNGIVLVFSLYRDGAAEDVSINSFFISKKEVELLDGAPHFFFLGINAGFSSLAGKYIYIHDNKLVGHEGNDDVGSSVISFNNSSYVLRYVIGV